MKILIVDDSKTARMAISQLIKKVCSECEILEAKSGKEALHLMTTNSFSHIFTDIQMEDMDGIAFVEKILKNKILANKRIVIISSTMNNQDALRICRKHKNVSMTEKESRAMLKVIEECFAG